ncbi:MAG: hypothetical protein ABIH85_02340 [Candidatus Omnitrophota bacterium]
MRNYRVGFGLIKPKKKTGQVIRVKCSEPGCENEVPIFSEEKQKRYEDGILKPYCHDCSMRRLKTGEDFKNGL